MSQHFIGMDLCKMWLTAALFWSKFILTLMWIVLAQVPYAQSKNKNKTQKLLWKTKKQGYSKLHQTPGNDLVDTWGHMDNPFNADTMRWGEFIQMLELQDLKWVNKEAVTHENSSFFFLLGIAGQSHINGMNLMLLFFMLPLVSLTFSFFIFMTCCFIYLFYFRLAALF